MISNSIPNDSTPLLNGKSATLSQVLTSSQPNPREVNGYLYVLLSALCLALSMVLNRVAQAKFNLAITGAMLVRGCVQLSLTLALSPLVSRTDMRAHLRLPRWVYANVLANAILTAAGVLLLYSGLRRLPAGDVAALYSTTPVVTMALGFFVLREAVSHADVLSAVLSVMGSVLVAAPWEAASIAPWEAASAAARAAAGATHLVGVASVLGYVLTSGVGFTIVGGLGTRVHCLATVGSAALAMVSVSLAVGGASEVQHSGSGVLMTMALAAALGCAGQLAMTRGLQLCRVGAGMVVASIEVPLAYGFALMLLHEAPGIVQGCGTALVLLGAVFMGLQKLS